jgi:ArsR family transcriptional regulator, arsenate/arsenite/antimonite-responsive transcriptional repressor
VESAEVVEAMGALAQESRLTVFRLLVRQGPQGMPAGEIAEKVGIPAPTLSFHLSQLSQAGLVASRRHGRSIYYAADYRRMQELMEFLMANCCEGTTGCRPQPTTVKVRRRRPAPFPRMTRRRG